MHIYATAKSDVGRVRERNEDAYLVNDDLGLFVVADGMGGHAGGARASRLTVETLQTFLAARKAALEGAGAPDEEDPAPPLTRLLVDAVRAACAAVYDAAAADPALNGMGTTCTLLLVQPGWGYVAHVGDSRCYMQRGATFMQITEDHSLVNEQVKAGILAPEDAAKSRLKNIITRSVGFEREVQVDTFLVPLRPGDQFLLCSDGLSNLVDNPELGEAMMAMQNAPLVDFLIDVALERGGDDNVTAVCVRVDDAAPGDDPLAPPEQGAHAGGSGPSELMQTAPELSSLPPVGTAAASPADAAPPVPQADGGGDEAADATGLAPGIPPSPAVSAGRRATGPNEDTDPQRRRPQAPGHEFITDPDALLEADLPTDPGEGGPAPHRSKRQ